MKYSALAKQSRASRCFSFLQPRDPKPNKPFEASGEQTKPHGLTSKLASLSQANRDLQSYVDSRRKLTIVPLVMLTEEMYRSNFILDKWLRRK